MEGETRKGAKVRRHLEGLERQEACPYCGELKVHYRKWKEPICPRCGAEIEREDRKED